MRRTHFGKYVVLICPPKVRQKTFWGAYQDTFVSVRTYRSEYGVLTKVFTSYLLRCLCKKTNFADIQFGVLLLCGDMNKNGLCIGRTVD